MANQQLLADARPHRVGKNRHLRIAQAANQAGRIIGHLGDGGVILGRVGGETHAAIIKEDQLMLAGQLLHHERIPEAHGGEKAVDHQQRLTLSARVVSQADVAHLGILDLWPEWRPQLPGSRSRQRPADTDANDDHGNHQAPQPGLQLEHRGALALFMLCAARTLRFERRRLMAVNIRESRVVL
jgi:hypothetical protein